MLTSPQAGVLHQICAELLGSGYALSGREFASMRQFLLLLDAAGSEAELQYMLVRFPIAWPEASRAFTVADPKECVAAAIAESHCS